MDYLETELSCLIVADIVSYIYWDSYGEDEPLDTIAKRLLSHFYNGDVKRRKRIYIDIIKEFKIDGVIHFMHRGCQPIAGSAWLVKEIAMELKIPYMELHGDCIDSRGLAFEQIKLRMEAFRESLEV